MIHGDLSITLNHTLENLPGLCENLFSRVYRCNLKSKTIVMFFFVYHIKFLFQRITNVVNAVCFQRRKSIDWCRPRHLHWWSFDSSSWDWFTFLLMVFTFIIATINAFDKITSKSSRHKVYYRYTVLCMWIHLRRSTNWSNQLVFLLRLELAGSWNR